MWAVKDWTSLLFRFHALLLACLLNEQRSYTWIIIHQTNKQIEYVFHRLEDVKSVHRGNDFRYWAQVLRLRSNKSEGLTTEVTLASFKTLQCIFVATLISLVWIFLLEIEIKQPQCKKSKVILFDPSKSKALSFDKSTSGMQHCMCVRMAGMIYFCFPTGS